MAGEVLLHIVTAPPQLAKHPHSAGRDLCSLAAEQGLLVPDAVVQQQLHGPLEALGLLQQLDLFLKPGEHGRNGILLAQSCHGSVSW